MNEIKKYYIQINSTSIAHFFVRGCILPSHYISNKITDIQNTYPMSILISTKKWNKSSDCALEVVFTDLEVKNFTKINAEYLLFTSVIPISRIKYIYFNDKSQAETTVWNVNNGAGFIPERLIVVEQKNTNDICEKLTINKTYLKCSDENLQKKIKSFNLLMGGFAFMKIGTNNPSDSIINYSENYIATLASFNTLIKKEYLKFNKAVPTKFESLFNDVDSKYKRIKPFFGKKINELMLKELAEKENVRLKSKFGIIQINDIPKISSLYIMVLISTYGEYNNKSIDNLISDMVNGKIENKLIEEVSLIFGLHTGYSSLRNAYKILGESKATKFQFKNKLDYYIVESLFQYAFYDKKISSSFPYLDNFIPKGDYKKNQKGYVVEEILDTSVITKKKDYGEYLGAFSKIISENVSLHFKNEFNDIKSEKLATFFKGVLKPEFDLLVSQIQEDSEVEMLKQLDGKEGHKKQEIAYDDNHIRVVPVAGLNKANISRTEARINLIPMKNYWLMSRSELLEVAKKKGLKGISKCKKEALIEKINSNDPNLFQNS